MSNAKSSATKQYEGHKDKSQIKPTIADGKPVKPSGMLPAASVMWDTTVQTLVDNGVATAVDQQSLESLCYWWAVFTATQQSMATITDWTTLEAGRAIGNSSRAYDNYRRLCVGFGLTPQARNNVSATPADELEEYEE